MKTFKTLYSAYGMIPETAKEHSNKPFMTLEIDGKLYFVCFQHYNRQQIDAGYAGIFKIPTDRKAVTVCFIYPNEYKDDPVYVPVYVGVAACGPDDNFSRRVGRGISFERAIKNLGIPLQKLTCEFLTYNGPTYPIRRKVHIHIRKTEPEVSQIISKRKKVTVWFRDSDFRF